MAYTKTPLYALVKRASDGNLDIVLDSICNSPHMCSRKVGSMFAEGLRKSGFKPEQIEISTVIRARRNKSTPVEKT